MKLTAFASGAWRSTEVATSRIVQRLNGSKPDVPTFGDVDRRYVHHTDAEISVADIGPLDADTTIVFIHGFTLTAQSWALQVRHLRQDPTLRLVLPDLRGHGRSSSGSELGVDAAARDIVTLVAQRVPSGRIVLVGHSLGVMVALAALRIMDAGTRERVAGVVLVNGAIDAFASAGVGRILRSLSVRTLRWAGQRTPEWAEGAKSALEWMVKPTIAGFVYHGALERGESKRFDIVGFHAQQIDQTSMRCILGFLDDLTYHDELDAAPFLAGIPGAVMVGDRDNVTPADQTRRIAELWPDARLREVHDAGHMLVVEQPEAVNEEIKRLLARLSPTGEQTG